MADEFVTFRASGPVFDGRADRAVKDFIHAATQAVGEQGVTDVRTHLHGVLKHPTGNYERHINVVQGTLSATLTDGGVVYGPWLEGVSSRNTRTRFKGYATFRRVTQALQSKTTRITYDVLRHFIGRMQ